MPSLYENLIAHYKMNENEVDDNAELVTNGDFAAWTTDNPDGWAIAGESGDDPEISEAATGEGHADTPTPGGGMCNLYTSDGTFVRLCQTISTLVVGRKYRGSITVDTIIAGGVSVGEIAQTMWTLFVPIAGTTTWTFIATHTDMTIEVKRQSAVLTDVTFDDVSIKLCAIEDSSGNDHHGVAQQDSSVLSVPGRVNTALEFNPAIPDYIIIPDHDDFTPAGTPFSISVWVKMVDATNFMIASKGVYNVDGEWRLYISGSDFLFFYKYDESVADAFLRRYNTSIALTAYENQWIHIAVTCDGSILHTGVKLYLNKVRIDDGGSVAGDFVAVENLAHDVWIGRYEDTYANGTIDNVMFFNKELTAQEVSLLYMNGRGTEILNMRRWNWWH